jgi:hypothetical protein
MSKYIINYNKIYIYFLPSVTVNKSIFATLITPEAKLKDGINLKIYIKGVPIFYVVGIILRINKMMAIID